MVHACHHSTWEAVRQEDCHEAVLYRESTNSARKEEKITIPIAYSTIPQNIFFCSASHYLALEVSYFSRDYQTGETRTETLCLTKLTFTNSEDTHCESRFLRQGNLTQPSHTLFKVTLTPEGRENSELQKMDVSKFSSNFRGVFPDFCTALWVSTVLTIFLLQCS